MSDRGVAPVIGVILLIALVAMLGGVVAALVPGSLDDHSTTTVSIDMEVDAGENEFTFFHRGGDTINVTDLDVRITIDGDPITHQPDLGPGSRKGLPSMPTGVFNPSTENDWSTGESGSLVLAKSNGGDDLEVGSLVTAEFYLDGQPLIELSTRAS